MSSQLFNENVTPWAFNPAVAIGATIRGLLMWSNVWLYIVAELLGGAAAAIVFTALNPDSRAT